MSTALYLKYRPKDFNEIIGQDHIVEALQGAIRNNTVPHAYLFVGPRGTGKTSTARILARALAVDPQDLYEIDAASNNGVDEIRELREAVRTLPFRSMHKLYIIDEVHMLSKQAFNAFLKTLEEPPPHVKFVLATTEGHKILDTITSRCQQLVFRSPDTDTLAKVAVRVAGDEGYILAPDAAQLVALLGDGSFRDTLSILQKIISGAAKKDITREDVEIRGGAPKDTLVMNYLMALLLHKTQEGLTALQQVREEQCDVKLFTQLVLQRVRLIMFARFAPSLYTVYAGALSTEARAIIDEAAKNKELGNLSAILSDLLTAYTRIGTAPIQTIPLEILLVNDKGR
ncbi:MAG: DNA polymerase III subunit gamma/tau [bacterium]|nr:DNA polymerase III subunit gamma/tau [bacterium]